MGRTDQVLTGGSLSYNPLTTTMKAVLALLLVCLVQISFAEQEDIAADGASSDTNLLLQREVREAAKGKGNKKQGCDKEGKKCKNKQKQMKKGKGLRKQQKKDNKDKKSRKTNQTNKTKSGKGGKPGKKDKKEPKNEKGSNGPRSS